MHNYRKVSKKCNFCRLGKMLTTRVSIVIAASFTCWMLLAVFITCWHYRASSAFQETRYEFNGPKMIMQIELLHREHPMSPLASPEGTTFQERFQAAAKRSNDRHLFMSQGRRLSEFTTTLNYSAITRTSSSFEYVMSIFFGTPLQKFTGVMDTGSDLVWVQCQPCITCFPNHPHPVFDPASSTSHSYVPCFDDPRCDSRNFNEISCTSDENCQIDMRYGDRSQIEGVLATESMALTNTARGALPIVSESFLMGCMNNVVNTRSLFGPGFDGIVGFGRGPISLPSQVMGSRNVFTICLVPLQSATMLSSPLTLGTRMDASHGLVYTPLLDGVVDYAVHMVGVSVDGVKLPIPEGAFPAISDGGVVFDTGTVLTILPPDVYNPIHDRVATLVPYPPLLLTTTPSNLDFLCFDVSGVLNPTLPSVTFHFAAIDASANAVDYHLHPLDNAFFRDPAEPVVCLAIRMGGGISIIGNIAQANHFIEYDVSQNRIGWIDQDCTAPDPTL